MFEDVPGLASSPSGLHGIPVRLVHLKEVGKPQKLQSPSISSVSGPRLGSSSGDISCELT